MAYQLTEPAEFLASALLFGLLCWISLSDLKSYRIPDKASMALVTLGLIWSAFAGNIRIGEALIGAGAGYICFALLGEWYFRRTGQDGLGLGDAKLLAGAGAWLGWRDLPILVGAAAIAALTFALLTRKHRLAFGPWLAGAFWILWVRQVAS